jgi:hypothetical protein
MNLIGLKSRIEKALAKVKPGNPRVVVYHCHKDADEMEREMARDAALAEHQDHDGPLIILCLEHTVYDF